MTYAQDPKQFDPRLLPVPANDPGRRPGWLVAAARWVLRWPRLAMRAIRGRRAVAHMATLDDRVLMDLGLVRSDLRDAVALPPFADPTELLVRRSSERRSARRLSQAYWIQRFAARASRRRAAPYY